MKPVPITNSEIYRLANNASLKSRYAFLRLTIRNKACCGQPPSTTPDYQAIRRALGALPADALRGFLIAAGLATVRLVYRDAAGRITDRTETSQ